MIIGYVCVVVALLAVGTEAAASISQDSDTDQLLVEHPEDLSTLETDLPVLKDEPSELVEDPTVHLEDQAVHIEEPSVLLENSSIFLEEPTVLIEDLPNAIPVYPSNITQDPDNVVGGKLSNDSGVAMNQNSNHTYAYDGMYEQGIKHYLDEEWMQCAGYMNSAINDYRWYKGTLARCRRDCKAEAGSATPLQVPRNNEQEFFETTVRSALCLLKCRNEHFGSRNHHIASAQIDKDFETRKPYDYLQFCNFKIGRYQDAADAAVTVLSRQPDHKIMANNLRQYIDDYSVDPELLTNLELKEYAKEFVKGDKAHTDERYSESVEHMEKALYLYWAELEDCRLLCEEPFDQGWFPDFQSSIANHFTFTFRCKRRCATELSNLFGEEVEDFLPSIFNYLQYGYHKLNKVPAACGAVESFLELLPTDAAMIKNKQFYISEYQKMDRFFVPSKDVVEFAARERYEEALIHFIDTEFVFLDDNKKIPVAEETKKEPQPPRTVKQARLQVSSEAEALKRRETKGGRKGGGAVTVLQDSQLNGTHRYVADGLLSDIKCKILAMLTQVGAEQGDGYLSNINPHTDKEAFHGLTLSRAGLMVHAKLISADVLRLIINVTEEARDHLVQHFDIHQPLYFSYTHLVCRTARPEMLENRSERDMSHTVHVDNCIFHGPQEECLRRPPAYTFRDYSAILYLNGDFHGGEFIFTDDVTGQQYQSKVAPKCGRMVAFSSGPENPHGVWPVRKGTRCALALWFTHQEKHQEKDRILAHTLLKKINDGEIDAK